jgi:hypothetical protein
VEYFEALFDDDTEEITRIENAANSDGFGPLASCSTIWNANSIKIHCHKSVVCESTVCSIPLIMLFL